MYIPNKIMDFESGGFKKTNFKKKMYEKPNCGPYCLTRHDTKNIISKI